MDLDKIIEALHICSEESGCSGCPYDGVDACASIMKINAIAAIKELREELGEIDAQAQAIETLQQINAKLEGKVEAYENVLRMLAK